MDTDIVLPGGCICPDPWSRKHSYFDPVSKKIYPARCKRWTCFVCAQTNYYRVSYLAAAGKPRRFITLSRAGQTPAEINLNLKKLIKQIRRAGKKFEYFCVPELHANGQAHLHLLQRGDFIDFYDLQDMWQVFTSKSYGGKGSFHVRISDIQDEAHARRYLIKYLKKSWENHDDKSWTRLQTLYPGLNHYRMSRHWPLDADISPQKYLLVPNTLLPDLLAYYNEPENIRLDNLIESFLSGPELTSAEKTREQARVLTLRTFRKIVASKRGQLLTG